jgi:RHS repeat-associated protein
VEYDFVYEYYEDGGNARVLLEMESPSVARRYVSESDFRQVDLSGIQTQFADSKAGALAITTDSVVETITLLDGNNQPISDQVYVSIKGKRVLVNGEAIESEEWVLVSESTTAGVYEFNLSTREPGQKEIRVRLGNFPLDEVHTYGFLLADSKSGLRGEYFSNKTLTNPSFAVRDNEVIDFDWDNGAPVVGMPGDNYSVRWNGYITPDYSETYTFYTYSDDGMRLWIDGNTVVNSWIIQGPTYHSGSYNMTAGQVYDIMVEYYEGGGGAVAGLEWKSASQPREVIFRENLSMPVDNDYNFSADFSTTEVVGNGVDSSQVTVTLTDSEGNPVYDEDVYIRVSGTGNTFNGADITESIWAPMLPVGQTGEYIGDIKSITAEQKAIRFMVGGNVEDSEYNVLFTEFSGCLETTVTNELGELETQLSVPSRFICELEGSTMSYKTISVSGGLNLTPAVPGGSIDVYAESINVASGANIRSTDINSQVTYQTQLVNVDGAITANGGYAENGGSIFVYTDNLTGSGSIQANGSGGENPGRGGLITLNYVTKSYTGVFQAFGGEFGVGAGDPGAVYDVHEGQFNITNNGRGGTAIIPEGIYPLNNIQFENGTNVIFEGDNTEVGLTGSVIYDTGDDPVFTVEGVLHGPTDFVVQNYSFNGKIDTTQNLSFLSPTVSTLHAFAVSNSHVFNQFTIGEGVVLFVEPYRVDNNDFSDERPFVLNANSITIDGIMNTSELGYVTKLDPVCIGDGPGGGWGICEAPFNTSGNSNGGAHGGYGGVGYLVNEIEHPASVPYGSETEPVTLGSGGGGVLNMNCAGAGGGAIKLIANTTISLNGQISAYGEHGSVSTGCTGLTGGGGAGGSIWLQSPAITGNGEITAIGGDGIDDGSGSGGRISVNTQQFSGNILVNADSGESSPTYNVIPAEHGTIYLGAIDYINSSFVANPQVLPYGSGYSSEVTVTVLSTNGHGYPYKAPTIQLINGDSMYVNGQILNTSESVTLNETDVYGKVIFTATADSYGPREFIITVGGNSFASNGIINFVSGVMDPNLSSIKVAPTEVPVGIGVVSEVTVTLLADNGYPVLYEDIAVTLVAGDTMLINGQSLALNASIVLSETNKQGVLVFNASAETAGQRELVISVDDIEMTQHAVISFISTHINPDLSSISVTPDVVADGNAVSVVRLTARDENNHPISYGVATLVASGNAVVTQPTTTTDINGEAVGYISDATIESVTVTGYISGEVINQTANIHFDASDIALSLGGNSMIVPGQNMEVQVGIENLTKIPVNNTEISLTLPEQIIYISDNFQVTPSINGNVYTWNIGQVDPNNARYFSVICLLSASTTDGTNLPVTASVVSDTLENNISNNSSSKTFIANSGYGYDAEINEISSTLYIGSETTYKVLINNTGLLADQYAISVQSLDSFTTTLSSNLVAINAGGITEVDITVGSNTCQANTSVDFSVIVTSQSTGATTVNNATLIVDTNPLTTLIAPKQNSTSGSRTVLFSWITNPATTGILMLYPTDDPDSVQTFATELGTSHSVEVSDLVRHTSYTWYIQSQSACGSGTSSSRTFTVGNGIVFTNHNQNITVDRDYDQRIGVMVKNEDSVEHTLVTSVDNSYEDLIVNFVDSGSIDETITLQPGETRAITLAIHAQDAKLYNYQLNAHLIADEGTAIPIEDNANLNVSVLSEGDFSVVEDVAAFDPVQLSRTFIITNNGKTITDLTVEALVPNTGEQANIYLQPTINHARLATGQSIRVVAYPLFSADNVTVETTSASHEESLRESSLASILYNITVKGSGNTVSSSSSAACTGENSVYPVTVSNQTMTCSTSSWYCTNRPSISTTVRNPFNFNRESLYSAEVRLNYYPNSDVRPHSAQLSVNGTVVDSFNNLVPSGSYTSEVPLSAWNQGLAGSVSQNISLSSQHPNGGHYIVSTGFEMIANIKQATFYVCAPSIEAAPDYVPTMCDLKPKINGSPRKVVHWKSTQNSGVTLGSISTADNDDCPFGQCQNTQKTVADPINTLTGGLSFIAVDMSVPTAKGDLVFQRDYSTSTVEEYTSELGFGWTHNHDLRLIFPEEGSEFEEFVRYKGVQGNEIFFIIEDDGTYTAAPGITATLTKQIDAGVITYHLESNLQTHVIFNSAGKVLQRVDENGATFDYQYDTDGRLIRVEANEGARYLAFSYDAENRIIGVADHTGRSVSFTYDDQGDLVSAEDVVGNEWTYAYDSDHRMTQIVDPSNRQSMVTEYDYKGRATKQWDGEGHLVVRLRFNIDGSTTVYDGAGKAETHYYDENNTLVQQTDAMGGSVDTERNANFQPVQVTDQIGNVTELEWDDETLNLTKVTNALDEETSLTYDENNNITSVVDAKGNESTYAYNGVLLTSSTDVYDNTTSFTYDADGNVETITDAHSNTSAFDYNEYGQLISQTDAEGHSTSYVYDDLGRLVQSTDASGIVTFNEYNAAGWLMKTIRNYDAARVQNEENLYNITTTYTYDASGNMLTMTDTYGAVYQYRYDNNNRVIKMIDAGNGEITYEYDTLGRKTAEIDQLGRRTSYTYDSLDRVVAVTNALGNVSRTSYNTDGTVAYTTNALGQKTSYTYDALQRVVAVTDNAGNTTRTVYDEVGNMVESIDAMGRSTTYVYDNLNRMIRQTDPAGNITQSTYDEMGNLVTSTDARGGITTYIYDSLNRMVSTSDAMGNTTTYTYDALGRQSMVTDAKGRTTSFSYDILGRQVSVTDYLGNISSSTYDALGKMLTSQDAMGHVYTSVYDNIGRLSYQVNPLGGETHYTYDAVGNQLTVIDANGHTSLTVYDALNRAISSSDANGHGQTTTYNAIGNVTAVTDAAGYSMNYVYDNLNRQTSIIDANNNQTNSTYNVIGNRLSTIDANGIVTRYEYDQLNRLSSVLENFKAGAAATGDTNVRTRYAYDENGNRTITIDGNGNTTSFTYDALNRLISETDAMGHVTQYTYDELGNQSTVIDANGATITYQYDELNRLVLIDYPEPDANVSFTYNAIGQQLSMVDGLGTTTWQYDALGRTVSVTDPYGAVVGYSYDAVGNRTGLTYPDGKSVTYAYDPANMLLSVMDWNNQETQYSYSSVNRIIGSVLPNGLTSTYSYDPVGNLLSLTHQRQDVEYSSYTYTYDAVGNRTSDSEIMKIEDTTIFADAFESGDLSAWSSAQTDGGNLSVISGSWIEGGYLLKANGNGLNEMYVADNLPQAESGYNARFYLHLPYGWTMPDSSFVAFQARDAADNPVVQIRISKQNDQFMVGLESYDDNQQIVSSSLTPIMATWHAFEVEWHASSAPGANNGYSTLYVDDIAEATITSMDNDTMQIDTIAMGILSPSAVDFTGEIFFDDFTSNRGYYIGLNPDVMLPLVVKDNFESGDMSAWSSVQTDGINLSVSAISPIEGIYSLNATVNGQNEYYVQDDNPTTERNYNARLYINPESLVMPENMFFDILKGIDPAGTVFSVRLGFINGDYKLKIVLGCDDGTTAESEWIPIERNINQIELEWWRAWSWDKSDGGMRLWVNNVYKTSIEGKDNDTRSIESVLMGVLSPSSSTISGTIRFDAFISTRILDPYFGPDPAVTLPDYSRIFFETFKSGDLSAWDSAETNSGNLSITSVSPIEGLYSLQAAVNGQNEMYVHDDHPLDEISYTARFYVNPENLMIPVNEYFDIFRTAGSNGMVYSIRLSKIAGDYAIKAVIWDDNNISTETDWIAIQNGPNCIELGWFRAYSPEQHDGRLRILVNDEWKAYPGDIANFSKTVNYAEMGVLSPSSSDISGTVTFDAFGSSDLADTHIGLDPNITLPDYSQFVSDGFESGDMSAWSSAQTNGSNLSITSTSPIAGNYSLSATANGQNELYVQDDNPTYERNYNARFYFNPGSVTIPENSYVDILEGAGRAGKVFSIRLAKVDGDYRVKIVMVRDDETTAESDWMPIERGPNAIEIEWWRAWSEGWPDGGMKLWVNDIYRLDIGGLDTDTKHLSLVKMGLLSPSSTGISGTVYFDAFVSTKIASTHYGLDPNITVPNYSQIFFDTFESGDLSAWDSAVTNSGNLSITSDDPIEGIYSLQATVNGQNEMYVHDDHPLDEISHTARFYVNPENLVIPANEYFDIFRTVGSNGIVYSIRLSKMSGDYVIKAVIWDDNNISTETDWISIKNGPNCIELGWFRAYSPEVPDGRLRILVNDEWKTYPGDIDNYYKTVNYVEMGVLSPSSPDISGTVTFDAFGSNDWADNHIGLDPNITMPDYSQFVSDGFESGDTSAWSRAETDGGYLSVTATAALDGNYGLQAALDDQNEMYVEDNSPTGEQYYNARFYFDPNSVVIPTSDTVGILRGGGLGGDAFLIRLGLDNGSYAVKVVMIADDSSTTESAWLPIEDDVNYIEIEWARSWTVDGNYGWSNIWVNDNGLANPNGIGNGTKTIGYVQMGVLSPTSSNITGTVYFDDFASRNSGRIGENAIILLSMSSIPMTLDSGMTSETEILPLPTMTATAISTQVEEVISPTPETSVTVSETMTTETPQPSPTSSEPEPQLEDTADPVLPSLDTGMQMDDAAEPMLLSMSDERQIDVPPSSMAAEIEGTPTPEQAPAFTDTVAAEERSDAQLQNATGDEVQDQRALGRPGRHIPTITQTQQPSSTPLPSNTPVKPLTQQPSSTPLPSNTPWVEQASATPLPSNTPTSLPTATATSTFTVSPLPSNTPTLLPTATQTLVSGLDTRIDKALDSAETDLRMQEMALSAVLIRQPGSVTIDYNYDGLYRLTDAEYSNGDYYRYTYDAVGNRLTQETITETNTYTYDAANHMTSVDGVTYTWDANGNMLSDGANTYTYNKANRLTGVTGTDVSSFTYNGLGDRYQQIVNGTTTSFTLDTNSMLAQVLQDGTNSYIYGNSRISQVAETQTEYFLPDILGSVRQMVDQDGDLILTQDYEPYGNVIRSIGDGETIFGYTGEPQNTDLIYLRARYLNSQYGIFMSSDPFSGFDTNSISQNPYVYGYANPIKYTDPTGENPFALCAGALLATAPGGVTEIGGITACVTILAIAAISSIAIAQSLEDVDVDCPQITWEDIFNYPVQDSNISPETTPRPTPETTPVPVPYRFPTQTVTETPRSSNILYHYTRAEYIPSILATGIKPSLEGNGDAHQGPGQYFTDITPEEVSTVTRGQFSAALYQVWWHWGTKTDKMNTLANVAYIGIDTTGLPIERKANVYGDRFPGRGIFVNDSVVNLPITDRLRRTGTLVFQPSPSGYR